MSNNNILDSYIRTLLVPLTVIVNGTAVYSVRETLKSPNLPIERMKYVRIRSNILVECSIDSALWYNSNACTGLGAVCE